MCICVYGYYTLYAMHSTIHTTIFLLIELLIFITSNLNIAKGAKYILFSKIIAAPNEVALSYHRVRGLIRNYVQLNLN